LTFWPKNQTIRLTQLQPSEPGRYQGSCGWDFIQLRRHPPRQGQRHRRYPYVFTCTKAGDDHRLMTSIASCDPGTLDINGKVQIAVYDEDKAPLFPAIPCPG
jgi:hypothetical protein